jgi:hypothetical protein
MPRYRFELATAADDPALRELLAVTPTDGHISVSFRREPSFLEAAAVHGPFHQTVVCRDTLSGALVGAGVRSVREMFVNGRPRPIGYLSGLRVRPEFRNLGLVARGYRFFHELHADGRAPLYLTTIAEGNRVAQSVLTSARAGLPPYHDAGRYFTFVLSPRRSRNGTALECGASAPLSFSFTLPRPKVIRVLAVSGKGKAVLKPRTPKLPALLDFWNTHGRQRQFFPSLSAADFEWGGATFRGLQAEDVLTAERGGRIVATLGVWDQTAFRQNVVERYSRPLAWLRPVYNAWAALRGGVALPAVGMPFRHRVAALPVVADDDPAVFAALLETARRRIGTHLLVGLHERDPLAAVARAQAMTVYVTRLYHVGWDDGEALRTALDDRPPYLELGTL